MVFRHTLVLAVSLILAFLSISESYAQCAMCKATVENAENSDVFASGLNSGILYLMSIPYILFGVIAFSGIEIARRIRKEEKKLIKS